MKDLYLFSCKRDDSGAETRNAADHNSSEADQTGDRVDEEL